jgi:hypothetical protein
MTNVSLALSVAWVVLALGPVLIGRCRLGAAAVIALIALGTPILGLLTWQHGPVAGFAGLGVGALCLSVPPRGPRRDGGRGAARGTQPAE